jgi:hypothetical protein
MWSWFDLAFPWLGAVGAALLLVLLFGTRRLQRDLNVSRWRDVTWLAWLAVVAYLLHNIEEYGVDALGHVHGFPDGMCMTVGLAPFPACIIPPAFFLVVNIPLFWVEAPFAATRARLQPLVGLSFYGVIFVNALAHIVPFIARGMYSSGVVTAALMFLPISFWVARVSGLSSKALAFLVINGVFFHGVLLALVQLLVHGVIGPQVMVGTQLVFSCLILVPPWLAEKWLINRGRRPGTASAG